MAVGWNLVSTLMKLRYKLTISQVMSWFGKYPLHDQYPGDYQVICKFLLLCLTKDQLVYTLEQYFWAWWKFTPTAKFFGSIDEKYDYRSKLQRKRFGPATLEELHEKVILRILWKEKTISSGINKNSIAIINFPNMRTCLENWKLSTQIFSNVLLVLFFVKNFGSNYRGAS